MLQLPTGTARARFVATPRPVKARSKRTVSVLEAAIAAHKSAARKYANLQRKEDAFHAANPGMRENSGGDYKALRARRKAAGIDRLETRRYHAVMAERTAFNVFIRTQPKSQAEIARYARYLLVAIPQRVGGPVPARVYSSTLQKLGVTYAEYQERELEAFRDMHQAILALARG